MLSDLSDPDPWVRAATLDVVPLLPWKAEYAQAVAPLLGEGHWLVRLAVIELLATQQGSVFSPVAGRLAGQDPDPLIRKLALLHLQRLQAPQLPPTGPTWPAR